jgi:hypothetical protein
VAGDVVSTRCPFAKWRPISANHTTGGRKPIRGFVAHVQVGNGSLFGYFDTPKAPGEGASADFWCSKAGELEQYVDLADQAWAQGSTTHNGNPDFFSCEFEGFPDEPMTPEQIAAGGRLIAWSREEVNDWPLQLNLDPDNGYGITPHHVFGGGHTCPGPGPREGQFPDLIAAAAGTGPAPQPIPPVEDDMAHRRFVKAAGTDRPSVFVVPGIVSDAPQHVPDEGSMGLFEYMAGQLGAVDAPPKGAATETVGGVDVWALKPADFDALFPGV